jgi:hypothetical protein
MLFDEPADKEDEEKEEEEEEEEEEDNGNTRIVRKIWDSATGAFRKIVKKIG